MKKTTRRKGKIRGLVEITKVSERVLTQKLVSILGEETVKGKSLDLKTEVLVEWYLDRMEEAKKAGRDEFSICENCGGPCEDADPDRKCHFCGTGFDADAPPVDVDKVDVVAHTRDLDDAVERVKTVLVGSSRNFWQLGRELCGIFDNKLYLTRVDENGNRLYRSWEQFSETELGISGARAYAFMDVAREFTEEQVVAIGVEKLRTIRTLPENRRAEFIVKAPSLTTRALANEVRSIYRAPNVSHQAPKTEPVAATPEARKKQGLSKGTEAAKKARDEKKAQRQAQVESGEGVTAVFQLGEYEIPLEPEGDDDFKGTETLVNGVVTTYFVSPVGKKPFLRITRVREGV